MFFFNKDIPSSFGFGDSQVSISLTNVFCIAVIPIDGIIAFIGFFFEIIKYHGLVGLSQKLLSSPVKYLKFDGEVIITASIFSFSICICIFSILEINSSFGKSFIN